MRGKKVGIFDQYVAYSTLKTMFLGINFAYCTKLQKK